MPVMLTYDPRSQEYIDSDLMMRLPFHVLASRVDALLAPQRDTYYGGDVDEAIDTVLSEVTIDDLVAIR